jgi:hypothetical protein
VNVAFTEKERIRGMQRIAALFAIFIVLALPLRAQQAQPVLVELFTSQGCSSCPPADAYLTKLAARDDVIALALHVDYWDYIGWSDQFADPTNTKRQKSYAWAAGTRMVYTPQFVIGGQKHVAGMRPSDIEGAIHEIRSTPPAVDLGVQQRDGAFFLRLEAKQRVKPSLIQVVHVHPHATTNIEKGENAGRMLSYSNIVVGWEIAAEWDGVKPMEMALRLVDQGRYALIVQQKGYGPVLAARWLR